MMVKKVADLEGPPYLLLSDSQERRAVLESIGRGDELSQWPHLLVWAEEGELLEVWGVSSDVPYLEAPAVLLYDWAEEKKLREYILGLPPE